MSAKILDGKALAAQLKEQLQGSAKEVCIVSITVGNDPSAFSYLKSQKKAAQDLSIEYREQNFNESTPQSELIKYIEEINRNPKVQGVIVNKPLPKTIDYSALINQLDPSKDIEGLGERNQGRLLLGKKSIVPCTPGAAVALLKSSGVDLKGKEAVVIGRSEIVGKPAALLLLKEDMTVTVCHSKTKDLSRVVGRADVVIAAVGKPLFVKGDWIKPGAIVVDVGINELNGKIVGDVDFDSCKDKASFISPVPGGVGPVTAVLLMKNALEASKLS